MLRIFTCLFLIAFSLQTKAQIRDSVPWYFDSRKYTWKTKSEKTCKFPLELDLEDRVVEIPKDFKGEYTTRYTDGSIITVEGDDCWSALKVTEQNERKGYTNRYLFEPKVEVTDTVFRENYDPPYDLQMILITQYTFR